MNPFPGRLLRNRRVLHLERLQGELRELEEQQKEFVTESAQRKDKELDGMVSEDDDEIWSYTVYQRETDFTKISEGLNRTAAEPSTNSVYTHNTSDDVCSTVLLKK